MKKIKEVIFIHIILIIFIAIAYLLNIRTCLFYNIFHVPCVGCGLSRGIISIINANILEAIRYNFLSIVIVLTYIVVFIWSIIDIIIKKETLSKFIANNKRIIIIICSILTILAWIININNPLLY